MCLVPHYYKDIRIPPEFFVDDEPVYRPGDCILTNISAPYVLRQQALQLGIDSLTLLARNGKIRPGTVIAVPSESSIYYTICLMATFGDTEYEKLEDKLLKHFSVKVLTFDDKPDENTPRIGTTPTWEHYPQHLIAIPVKCTKEELIAPCFSSRVDHRGFRVPFRFESDAREAILKCALMRRRDWNVDLRDPVKKQAWAEEYLESQVRRQKILTEQRALKKRDEQAAEQRGTPSSRHESPKRKKFDGHRYHPYHNPQRSQHRTVPVLPISTRASNLDPHSLPSTPSRFYRSRDSRYWRY